MARYLKPPVQQFVEMGSPVDVNFYSNLLGQAQQNLDRGVAIKAAAIEKLYDVPFLTKEDSDAVVGRAQDILKNATEGNLVSPSRVTNAVLSANAEVMPGVQAAKAKAKAADMYDAMRIKYGADAWMGDNPASISILDKTTGKYVDPNTFEAVGISSEDIVKPFLGSQLSTLNQQGELTYSREGAPTGKLKTRQVTGISKEDRERLYYPGTENARGFAMQTLQARPEILKIFKGDTEKALAAIENKNWETSGAYQQKIESSYIDDNAWEFEQRRKLAADNTPPPPDLTSFLPAQREASKTAPWVTDMEYSFTKDLTDASSAPTWRGGAFVKYNDVDKNINEMQARYNVADKLLKSGKGSVSERANATNERTRSYAEMKRLRTTKNNLMNARDAYILNKAAELGYNVDNVNELPKEAKAAFDKEIPKNLNSLASFLDAKKASLLNTTDFYNPLSIETNKAINNIFNPDNPSLYKDKGFRIANSNGDILPIDQVADKFDIEPVALSTQLNTKQINYNRGTGEFFADVYTSGKMKDGKFTPEEDSDQERVYFRLDVPTANYTNLLTTARKLNNNKSTKKEVIFRSDKLNVEYAGNGVFNVAMINPANNQVVTVPSVDLGSLQDMVGAIIDAHVTKNYTIPSMSVSGQKYFDNQD